MPIKSKRDAFAAHYDLDFAETEHYRYHYGLTSQPVWAFTDKYVCVVKKGQKPATHREGMTWEWEEVVDPFVNKDGYKIFESGTEI